MYITNSQSKFTNKQRRKTGVIIRTTLAIENLVCNESLSKASFVPMLDMVNHENGTLHLTLSGMHFKSLC